VNAVAPIVFDQRALLHSIGSRLVREVAREKNPYSAALIGVVLDRQVDWPIAEFDSAVDELFASDLTIAQFLEREAAR
jgi:hypothetical protein